MYDEKLRTWILLRLGRAPRSSDWLAARLPHRYDVRDLEDGFRALRAEGRIACTDRTWYLRRVPLRLVRST